MLFSPWSEVSTDLLSVLGIWINSLPSPSDFSSCRKPFHTHIQPGITLTNQPLQINITFIMLIQQSWNIPCVHSFCHISVKQSLNTPCFQSISSVTEFTNSGLPFCCKRGETKLSLAFFFFLPRMDQIQPWLKRNWPITKANVYFLLGTQSH